MIDAIIEMQEFKVQEGRCKKGTNTDVMVPLGRFSKLLGRRWTTAS